MKRPTVWAIVTTERDSRPHEAIRRAERLTLPERVLVAVSAYAFPLELPGERVRVLPSSARRAEQVLACLPRILQHEESSIVVVIPAHRSVEDEETLRRALAIAVAEAIEDPSQPIVLGMTPAFAVRPSHRPIQPAAFPLDAALLDGSIWVAGARTLQRWCEAGPADTQRLGVLPVGPCGWSESRVQEPVELRIVA
ncbi:MAG TPA: hypothetical protein VJS92_08040 [Candidatus Polarisedimenticolaceae bacterium]|nr:hypothetical protein [Candidatus Polarisedimenticolaceae bacterium]